MGVVYLLENVNSMFFIAGRRSKIIGTYEDENTPCEDCNSNSLVYFIYQEYYHLFWLPVIPTRKFGGIYCESCEKSKVDVINKKVGEYEEKTKTPIYMYSGAVIIGGIIIFGIILNLID